MHRRVIQLAEQLLAKTVTLLSSRNTKLQKRILSWSRGKRNSLHGAKRTHPIKNWTRERPSPNSSKKYNVQIRPLVLRGFNQNGRINARNEHLPHQLCFTAHNVKSFGQCQPHKILSKKQGFKVSKRPN